MQRGITAIFILISFAAIIGVVVVVYGYFIATSKPAKTTVELPPEHLIPPPATQVGTPGCPDTDYTGCDNSSLWMTWDGNIPEQTPEIKTDSTGTIYSK